METGRRRSKGRSSRRKCWSAAEDIAITNLVQENGTRQWTMIAERLRKAFKLKGRTGKQCRERWHNHLDPLILRTPWTLEEEQVLFEAHQRLGNKWADISKILAGRTDNSIKNHYYSAIRREFRRLRGVEPTRSQLKDSEEISNSILNKINAKIQPKLSVCPGDEYFAEDYETDLPLNIAVQGHTIALRESSSEYSEAECKAEFLWPGSEANCGEGEVFCLPWY
jgi:hypothetical protein